MTKRTPRSSVNLDRVYKIGEPLTFIVDYRTKGEVVPNTLGFGGGGGLKFIKPDGEQPERAQTNLVAGRNRLQSFLVSVLRFAE